MNLKFFIIFISLIISVILSLIISFTSFILSQKTPNKEKVSVYECGFDPFHTPGEPFSIRFFVIGILFLIFDLEISYLIPWSANTNLITITGQIIVFLFLIILIIGLLYEWKKGGLEWE